MKSFQANPYPEDDEMHQYARMLNVSEKKIRRWYIIKRHNDRQKAGYLAKGEEYSPKNHH